MKRTVPVVSETVILVSAIILVGVFPVLLLPVFIGTCLIGAVGIFAIILGLVDMNKEALQLQTASTDERYANETGKANPDSASTYES